MTMAEKRPKYLTVRQKRNNIEIPKHFMNFLRPLVIAFTIHARIMCVCCCPLHATDYSIFTILQKMQDGATESDQVV